MAVSFDFAVPEDERIVLDQVTRFAATLRERAGECESDGAVAADLVETWHKLGLDDVWSMGARLACRVLVELAAADASAMLALDGSLVGAVIDIDERLTLADGRLTGALPCVPGQPQVLQVVKGGALYQVAEGLEMTVVAGGALSALSAVSVAVDGTAVEGDASVALRWRLVLASALTGLARASYEYARDYCLERVTFGRKVAHHQAVAFILADMATAAETASVSLEFAAEAGSAAAVTQAYLQAVESALFNSDFGVQLLGAAGYVSDHPVEKWMREARAISLLIGGVDAAMEGAL